MSIGRKDRANAKKDYQKVSQHEGILAGGFDPGRYRPSTGGPEVNYRFRVSGHLNNTKTLIAGQCKFAIYSSPPEVHSLALSFPGTSKTVEDTPVSSKNFLQTLKVTITVATIAIVFVPVLGAAPKEKVLHVFNGSDGAQPASTLTFDKAGNLYGTTFGGAHTDNNLCGLGGCGTVFD